MMRGRFFFWAFALDVSAAAVLRYETPVSRKSDHVVARPVTHWGDGTGDAAAIPESRWSASPSPTGVEVLEDGFGSVVIDHNSEFFLSFS